MSEAVCLKPVRTSVFERVVAVVRSQFEPPARVASDEKTALERALARAEGTWGGYMAAPPAGRLGRGPEMRRN